MESVGQYNHISNNDMLIDIYVHIYDVSQGNLYASSAVQLSKKMVSYLA